MSDVRYRADFVKSNSDLTHPLTIRFKITLFFEKHEASIIAGEGYLIMANALKKSVLRDQSSTSVDNSFFY